jgi:hypothetical protein
MFRAIGALDAKPALPVPAKSHCRLFKNSGNFVFSQGKRVSAHLQNRLASRRVR